jgi:uncharacterized protein YecA (UPF0149 family)
MKPTTFSIEGWKALYQAAKEFREIKPWQWMTETDIFGVQNPLTGEVGYCCVMGELGEVLAMSVYLGTGGLQGYISIIEELVEPDDPDSMFVQDCLMVSFEDRDGLEKEDMALIKKTGLKFSGKRAWPLFRRYEPGFFPSPIAGEDVKYLTAVLQQAKGVCLRLKEDKNLLINPEENVYLVRVPDSGRDSWVDAWMPPAPLQKIYASARVDELRILKIQKIAKHSPVTWEVDFFFAPTPIEGERPYFPYTIMIADSGTGYIHDVYLSDTSTHTSVFPERFLSCLEKTATIPSTILARKDETVSLLQPITLKLGIKLDKTGKLPAIDNARISMTKHFQSGDPLLDEYCGDEVMEEYLEMAGSELSIYGLYGLLYGCLAAPDPVMPSEFMPLVFGKKGPQFGTEEEAQEMSGNMMALWNLIGQWDPETEDLMIPEFDYDADIEGALFRIYDALSLAGLFLAGLELGGVTVDHLLEEMKEDAKSLLSTTELLYESAELLKKEKKSDRKKIEETMKAVGNGEFIIAECIANITIGLKGVQSGGVEKCSPTAQGRLKGKGEKVGRNEPCPCGSGKKYKNCCGILH